MKKIMIFTILVLIIKTAFSAVGCDLNDPDRDVKRLFPASSGYRTIYKSVQSVGGEKLLHVIESRLGDKFSGLYETIDVPYTIYEIFRDETQIGFIHGVNEKGKFGGIQVFLALDMNFKILSVYFQRLSTRQVHLLKEEAFLQKFIGLDSSDFASYDVLSGEAEGKLASIKSPHQEHEQDFRAILRGMKKNLILMEFMTIKEDL